MRRREAIQGLLLTAPLLTGVLVFFGIPLLWVVLATFRQGGTGAFVGFENYVNLLKNRTFTLALGNTLKFLAAGLPLIMALSMAIALALRAQAAKFRALRAALLLPYVLPALGAAQLADLFFSSQGMLAKLWGQLGLAWEGLSGPGGFWALVALYLWKDTGYGVILLLSGLAAISPGQYESAQLDGAGPWRRFWNITLPQMGVPLFFALVFAVINAFQCFREIFLLSGEHPADEFYLLQHFLNNCFENVSVAKLSTASVVLLVILLAFFGGVYLPLRWKEGD